MRNLTFVKTACIAVLLTAGILGSTFAQPRKITGSVSEKNTKGGVSPLIGVNVVIKGTQTGTSTDMNGRYSLDNVPAGATLVFSCLGYETQEISIGEKTTIDVTMENDTQMIEALVVVGYGSQRKSDIATSVASVDADQLKAYPGGNITEMLRGRAAGVNITSTSGRPGAIPDITIRGSRSITAKNLPLFVIDGCTASAEEFATISSTDISSIEILKDAAAQAIYGARASDGVVLVTTKRGQAGRAEISYNGYVSVQSLWRNFDFYNGEEWYNLRREAKAADAQMDDATLLPMETVLSDYIMEEVYKKGESVNWEKLMLKKAVAHNHELNIRGGSEKIRFSTGLNYFDQNGMVVTGSGYQRGSLRLNTDYQATDWLTIGLNASYTLSKEDREDGNFNEYITRQPLGKVYEEDGSYTKYLNAENYVNPLYRAQYYDRNISVNRYRINAFLDIKLLKGLSYRLNTSYYNRASEDGTAIGADYPGGGAMATLEERSERNYLIENILRYDVPIRNTNHKLNITAVQSIDCSLEKALFNSVNNLPVDKDWNYIANGQMTEYKREYEEHNLVSFLFRAQYSFKDRYIMNLAIRRDGSSRFGPNNKWGNFPSAAFAWRINEESFLKNVQAIDNLKLRVSYGIVGNQNGIANYSTLGVSNPLEYEFGDSYHMAYMPSEELSNPNLRWEQSATANFGVDFGFFNNRLSGFIEYYRTRTTDLLVTRSLNKSLGYSSMLDNLGETRSSGVDFSLNVDAIRKTDFNWNIGINFSHYQSEIVKIDDQVDENGKPLSQPGNEWIIGAPINSYYDYVADGIYQYSDFDMSIVDGKKVYTLKNTVDTDGDGLPDAPLKRDDTVLPGCVKIVDLNGDGVIDENDRKAISREPDFTLSLSNTFTWKGFDFYMDWYALSGKTILNPYLYSSNHGGSLQGKLNGIKVNYWTPTNPSNEAPRPTHNTNVVYHKSLGYQDASYIRLRTLQLGYTIPQAITRKAGISRLRVYATATNLLTFTKFLSYSPELNPGEYPEARQFVFGLNLIF